MPPDTTSKPERGRGGRATGRGRGGAGRGGQSRDQAIEMTPSGPFAMGPSGAGITSSSKRNPNLFSGASSGTSGKTSTTGKVGQGLTKSPAASLPRNRDNLVVEDALEVYSSDEDVVDLDQVKNLDIMAPDALKKERRKEKKKKVKAEPVEGIIPDNKGKGPAGKHVSIFYLPRSFGLTWS